MHGTKSFLNRLLRQSGYDDVPTKVPALQGDDRTPNLQGQSDLREPPVLAAYGDDRVPRTDDREVADLARARREGVRDVGVGPPSVGPRRAGCRWRRPLLGRSARRSFHYAREAASDDDVASGSDEPSYLPGLLVQLSRGSAGSHDRDVERTIHDDAPLTRGSGVGRGRSSRWGRCSGVLLPTLGCRLPPRPYAKPQSHPCRYAPSPGRPS